MMTSEQLRRVVDLFEDGSTPDQVAAALCTSRSTLTKDLGLAGFEIGRKITWYLAPVPRREIADEIAEAVAA
jgi:DNA invertase Pin-like site-specific DNA recombinase